VRARDIISDTLARTTKPMTLTVHAKPRLGSNFWAIIGKTIPPEAYPEATRAIANERFLKKYVDTKLRVGQNSSPFPIP